MDKISEGKYVELIYDLFEVGDGRNELMYSFTTEQPDRFVFGMDPGMLEGFKNGIMGLSAGDAFDFTLSPEQAFGPVMEEMIMEFRRELFEVDGEFDDERVKVGNTIEMLTADGHRVAGEVLEVGPKKVKMDFNHPLAGQTIKFTGKVRQCALPPNRNCIQSVVAVAAVVAEATMAAVVVAAVAIDIH